MDAREGKTNIEPVSNPKTTKFSGMFNAKMHMYLLAKGGKQLQIQRCAVGTVSVWYVEDESSPDVSLVLTS